MRLIDVDALPISVGWMEQGSKQEHCAFVFEKDIKDAPTVDAVEIVRCKDCKYYNGNNKFCDYSIQVSEEDYCSIGERREVTK